MRDISKTSNIDAVGSFGQGEHQRRNCDLDGECGADVKDCDMIKLGVSENAIASSSLAYFNFQLFSVPWESHCGLLGPRLHRHYLYSTPTRNSVSTMDCLCESYVFDKVTFSDPEHLSVCIPIIGE